MDVKKTLVVLWIIVLILILVTLITVLIFILLEDRNKSSSSLPVTSSSAIVECFQENTKGFIYAVAGIPDPIGGFSGDGGDPLNAQFALAGPTAFDRQNCRLYISDILNNRIRMIDYRETTPIINTVIGSGVSECNVTNTNPAQLSTFLPTGMHLDEQNGFLYLAASNNIFQYQSRSNPPTISRWAGLISCLTDGPNDGPKLDISLGSNTFPYKEINNNTFWICSLNLIIRIDNDGNALVIAGQGNDPVTNTPVDPSTVILTDPRFPFVHNNTLYIVEGFDVVQGRIVQITNLDDPFNRRISIFYENIDFSILSIAFDPITETIFFGTDNFAIYKAPINNITQFTLIAGQPGVQGNTGNNGDALQATIDAPICMSFDGANNLIVSFTLINVIRRICLP